MPLRAFVDSDVINMRGKQYDGKWVLMPLRAFVDSDFRGLPAGTIVKWGLNALTGIC